MAIPSNIVRHLNTENITLYDKRGNNVNLNPEPYLNMIFGSDVGRNAAGYAITDPSGFINRTSITNKGWNYDNFTTVSLDYTFNPNTTLINVDSSIYYKDVSIFNPYPQNSSGISSVTIDSSLTFIYPSVTYVAAVFLDVISVGLIETEHLIFLQSDSSLGIITPTDASNSTLVFQLVGGENQIQLFTVDEHSQEITWTDQIIMDISTYVVNQGIQINIGFRSSDEGVYERNLIVYHQINGVNYPLMQIVVNAQSVGEDERFDTLLDNFGLPKPKSFPTLFQEADINEALPDWQLLNYKAKHLILEHDKIIPYIGTYKGLINAIKWLGYEDIQVKEWFKDVKSGNLLSLYVPYDADGRKQTIKYFTPEQRKNLKKLNHLSLIYCITKETGELDEWGTPITEDCFTYNLDEIFVKLYALKKWLEKNIIGVNARIYDITGEGIYFETFGNYIYGTQNNESDANYEQSLTPATLDESSELISGDASIVVTLKEFETITFEDLDCTFLDMARYGWDPSNGFFAPDMYNKLSYIDPSTVFFGSPISYPFEDLYDIQWVLDVSKEYGVITNQFVTNPLFVYNNELRFYNVFDTSSIFLDISANVQVTMANGTLRDSSIDVWEDSLSYTIYPEETSMGVETGRFIFESSSGELQYTWGNFTLQPSFYNVMISSNEILAGTSPNSLILQSADDGSTWTNNGSLNLGTPLAFCQLSNGNVLYTTDTGKVVNYNNNTSHSVSSYSIRAITQNFDLSNDYVCGDDNGDIYNGVGLFLSINKLINAIIYVQTDSIISFTSSGIYVNAVLKQSGNFTCACNCVDGSIFAGTNDGYIWKSINYGNTWTNVHHDGNQILHITQTTDNKILYTLGTSRAFRIFDNTFSIAIYSNYPDTDINSFATSLLCSGNNIVLFGASNGKIFKSTNNGLYSTDIGQQFSQTSINCLTKYVNNNVVSSSSSKLMYAYDDNYMVPLLTIQGFKWTDASGNSHTLPKQYILEVLNGTIRMDSSTVNQYNDTIDVQNIINFTQDVSASQELTLDVIYSSPRIPLFNYDPSDASTLYYNTQAQLSLIDDNSSYQFSVNHIGDYNIAINGWNGQNNLFFNYNRNGYKVWQKYPSIKSYIDTSCAGNNEFVCVSTYLMPSDISTIINNDLHPIFDRLIPIEGLTLEYDNNGNAFINVPGITFFQELPEVGSICKFYNLTEKIIDISSGNININSNYQWFNKGDSINIVHFNKSKYSFISETSANITNRIGSYYYLDNHPTNFVKDLSTDWYVLNDTKRLLHVISNNTTNRTLTCDISTGNQNSFYRQNQLVDIIINDLSTGYSFGAAFRVLEPSTYNNLYGVTHILDGNLPNIVINDPSRYTLKAKHAFSSFVDFQMNVKRDVEQNDNFKIYLDDIYYQQYYLDNTFTFLNILFDQQVVLSNWFSNASDNTLINVPYYPFKNSISLDLSTLVILRGEFDSSTYMLNQKNIWEIKNRETNEILMRVNNFSVPYVFDSSGTYDVILQSFDKYGNLKQVEFDGLIEVNG